jgi:hypothetical protein
MVSGGWPGANLVVHESLHDADALGQHIVVIGGPMRNVINLYLMHKL